jgi:hypothetical protein
MRTDQQSFKYLLEQRITTPAQTRWLPKIMRYEYIIGYKKGVDNQAADSLSRVTEFQFSQFLLHMLIGGGMIYSYLIIFGFHNIFHKF